MKKLLVLTALLLTANVYAETIYYSDGSTSTNVGNTTYNSDGSSATQIGNTLYFSDGSTATRF